MKLYSLLGLKIALSRDTRSFYFKQREEVKKGHEKLYFKDEGGKIT
jgi:hypothetical protein